LALERDRDAHCWVLCPLLYILAELAGTLDKHTKANAYFNECQSLSQKRLGEGHYCLSLIAAAQKNRQRS
jgi:hypothetical protein